MSKTNIVIFSNYDVFSNILNFLDINDLKRLKLVSKSFINDIKYYIKYNKNFIPKLEKQYLFWFNNNFKYKENELNLKNKKEGENFKTFIKMFIREYNVVLKKHKRKIELCKMKLLHCKCEKCNKKLSYLDTDDFDIKLKFNSFFHYKESYKFIKMFENKILLDYSDKISDIIRILPFKSYKLLLIILLTTGIKHIYNAKYQSLNVYSIHIKKWVSLEELYYNLIVVDIHISKLLDTHNDNVRSIIHTYFTKDECVRLLFQYMSDYLSINKKRKITCVDNFIN